MTAIAPQSVNPSTASLTADYRATVAEVAHSLVALVRLHERARLLANELAAAGVSTSRIPIPMLRGIDLQHSDSAVARYIRAAEAIGVTGLPTLDEINVGRQRQRTHEAHAGEVEARAANERVTARHGLQEREERRLQFHRGK